MFQTPLGVSHPTSMSTLTSINPSQRLQIYGICTFCWSFKVSPDPQRTSERSAVQGNGQKRLRGIKMTSPSSQSLYTADLGIRSLPPPPFSSGTNDKTDMSTEMPGETLGGLSGSTPPLPPAPSLIVGTAGTT